MITRTIIFDFDGVIHNTFEFHRQKVGEFTGVLLSEDDFRDLHNGNFFANKQDNLKGVDWEAYRDFIYESQSKLNIEAEIKSVLLELGKTHDLFIITSGGKKNITDYLESNGVGNIFKEILGLESYRSKIDKFNSIFKTHNLIPEDCLFITDTLGDILEANEVKVTTIAVDFGFHPRETLEKGKPYKIVSKMSEILEML
ncbi:MAG: HAD family hydrolase [Candidatus Pacebacteria bacterium]|nr:HAD family hydrolase [Candidatus Paceibacterota bacterium]